MRDKIREFIAGAVNMFDEDARFTDDQNIFQSRLVSSLFAVQLISFIEQEFGIKVDNADMRIENFQSVDRVVEFVTRKQAGASA